MLVLWLLACAEPVDEARVDDVLALAGDPAAGEALYADRCEECHGPGGDGQGSGPALSGLAPRDVVEAVLAGPCFMPAYGEELSDQDLADLAAYVAGL